MMQSHTVYCISVFLLILNFGWIHGADKAVLITGGINSGNKLRSAEVFLPATGHSCRLPDLPDNRWGHTQDGGLTCGGFDYGSPADQRISCLKWSPDSGSWTLSHTLTEERDNHVSWTPDPSLGTYLIGKFSSYNNMRTSELVKPDGSVEQGFSLKYDTR